MLQFLEKVIIRDLSDLHPEIEPLETESAFVDWLPLFDSGKKKRPDVVVIDVMLRWTNPHPEQPERPPDVIEGGFMRAGLRCLERIRANPKLIFSRVILFTVLTKEDLNALGANMEGVDFLPKTDGNLICNQIRAALGRSRN